MHKSYDYSVLYKSEIGLGDTWEDIYDTTVPLSRNLLDILEGTIFLPHDFYDIVATYFLLPSALCKTVPYLFLYGQSGSGKSTVAKVASYLHGCSINSSSDTFAGIRNTLENRRYGYAEVPDESMPTGVWNKRVERNICMVWDDIDASVFVNSPDLYRLFKFGSNKSTDTITISGKETGTNLVFHCFCPKVFSSISPLHLDDRFKELRRRLIVIPCKRVEELTDERKLELGVTSSNWQGKLLDLDAYDWTGFEQLFTEYWDMDKAKAFIDTRKAVYSSARGLSSQQRGISLDLISTGIVTGVWRDATEALERVKSYWKWFKDETEKNAGLTTLLKDYIKIETKNASNGNRPLEIYTSDLRSQIDIWTQQGWLLEKPKTSAIKASMLDLGMRHRQGKWIKG